MGAISPPTDASFINDLNDSFSADVSANSLIGQLDGNITLSSTISRDNLSPQNISVSIGNRPKKVDCERPPSTIKVIRRDNKLVQSVTFPKISVYNMRSVIPKIDNLATDIEDRNCSVTFLSEVVPSVERWSHSDRLLNMIPRSSIIKR